MKIRYLVALVLLPLGIVFVINFFAPSPSHEHQEERCTRYCHDHFCPHFIQQQAQPSSLSYRLYSANVHWLKNNPFGLAYRDINLWLYVVLAPMLMLLLLFLALRKKVP